MKTLLLLVPAAALLGALACEDRRDRDTPVFERIETAPAADAPLRGRGEGERESLDRSGMPKSMPLTPPASQFDVEPAQPSDDQAEGLDPVEDSGHDSSL